MAGFRVEGNTSGNVAEVDANNNLKINLPTTASQAGFAKLITQNDAGTITGTPQFGYPYVSDDSRMMVGVDTTLALYNFTALTQNTGDFKHAFVTMTCTQTSGFLNINPALSTVSGNYAYMQTWKHFTLQGDGTLHIEFTGQATNTMVANQTFEAGVFLGTAGIAPADGAFFRYNNGGLYGVMSYNGTETVSSVMVSSITPNTVGKFQMVISQRKVEFWIDGVLGASLNVPAAQAIPYLFMNLPVCMMMRNSGTVTGGVTMKIGTIHVTQNELATYKPWAEQCALQGNAYQGQEGDTMGSLAIYSNAALAAAAALTNTTAAAGNTGLGGAVLVLPTLAAGTDGILFSYQNPAGSATQPPKTLVVKGVTVSAAVQVVLAGGPLVYVMGVAFGHTAVSLATAETGSFVTATTKAPRRVPIGTLNCVVTAAVGTNLGTISIQFDSPIVVNPGEFFAITARNVATVTTTGAVVFTATADHYFE